MTSSGSIEIAKHIRGLALGGILVYAFKKGGK